MSITVSYPYDPTGTNVACLIKGERWSLSSINNAYRCIIPELAPFFAKDLKVVHITSGKVLRDGVDFYLGHRYKEIEKVADELVYGSLSFTDPNLLGEIELEYRTLGGNFVSVKRDVANYLINLLVDPVQVQWDELLNHPEFYPPEDHEQSWYDFVNTETIAEAIDGVTDSMQAYAQSLEDEGIEYIKNRIAQLEAIVENSNFDQHIINAANPHLVTYTQADALGKDQQAVAALKLYGKTLIELAEYLNAREVTQAMMDTYLRKTDDKIITQSLVLQNGVARIRNSGVESIVDLAGNNVKITCKGTAKLLANADRSVTDESFYLQAGNNSLRIRGRNALLERDGLTYNNQVVIHLGNLHEYLGTVNFGVVHVTAVDTATANWTGIGTTADPLKVSEIIPTASATVKGGVMLVAGTSSTSTTNAATAASLASVVNALVNYVPVTTTINDYPLSDDISFDKTYYGLGNVNNTSDLNKPISTAQQTALNTLANVGHKHSAAGITFNNASAAIYGITYLMSDVDDVGTLYAVTPAILQSLLNRTNVIDTTATGLLDRELIDLIYFNPDGVPIVPTTSQIIAVDANGDPILDANDNLTYTTVPPANWWLLTLPSGSLYYKQTMFPVNSISIDFSTAFTPYINKTFYLYVGYDDANELDQWSISPTKLAESEKLLLVGEVVTGATTFTSTHVTSKVSFGDFRELTEHMLDTNAHGYGTLNPSKVGLDLVENYSLSHVGNPYSPKNIIANWTNIDDSNATEVALWVPSDDLTYLNIPYSALASTPNSGKYLTAGLWDQLQYVSGALSRSQVELNWHVTPLSTVVPVDVFKTTELILGHYTEPVSGNQHYLSLVCITSPLGATKVATKLYYNYGKASQIDLGSFDVDPTNVLLDVSSPPSGAYPAGTAVSIFQTVEYVEDGGERSINVILRSGIEWGNSERTGGYLGTSRTNTTIKLTNIPTCPFKTELFNSGVTGFKVRQKAAVKLNYQNSTLVQTRKSYASGEVIKELVRRGHGVKVITGTITTLNGYPVPYGCSKGFVLLGINSFSNTTAIGSFNLSSRQTLDGDMKDITNAYFKPYLRDAAQFNMTGPVYNYTVIGFMDELDLYETI